jgi:hypothetical protein
MALVPESAVSDGSDGTTPLVIFSHFMEKRVREKG